MKTRDMKDIRAWIHENVRVATGDFYAVRGIGDFMSAGPAPNCFFFLLVWIVVAF